MARQDIAGLLTGISSTQQPVQQAVAGTPGFRGQFGAARAQGIGAGLGRLSRNGEPSIQEKIQGAIGQLDLNKVEDLAKLAQLQQIRGDLKGAAQTASKIQAIKQAEIEETRAKSRESRQVAAEIRAQESFEFGKIDRQDTKQQAAAREARAAELFSMQKAASEKSLSDEEKLEAQQGELRALYAQEATSRGRIEFAERILKGMSLTKIEEMLYKTSTAQIKAVTGDEKDAYDTILQTPAMQKLLPKALTKGFHKGSLNDATENAIFLKTKEIATREQIPLEQAMSKAIEVLTELSSTGKGENTTSVSTVGKRKQGRDGISETVEPSSDDSFVDLNPN